VKALPMAKPWGELYRSKTSLRAKARGKEGEKKKESAVAWEKKHRILRNRGVINCAANVVEMWRLIHYRKKPNLLESLAVCTNASRQRKASGNQ